MVYKLTSDKDNNFLMKNFIGTNWMKQPIFYRAIDTKEKDIFIPNFINDLEYNFWRPTMKSQ